MRVLEPEETETISTRASALRQPRPIRRQLRVDGICAEVGSLRTSKRSLVDRLAALELANQADIMRRLIQRANVSAALHALQPGGAAATSAELAWDSIRTFWTSGIVPPPCTFDMWTILPADAWIQLETNFTTLMRRAYAVYRAKPQRSPEQESLLRKLYLMRFSIMGALRSAPESYVAGVAGAVSAGHRRDDVMAASQRVAEAAAGIELEPHQLSGLSSAWIDFTDVMASIAADAVLLQGMLDRVSTAAESAAIKAREANISLPASTKAMYSVSVRVAAEALARCNARRLSEHLELAWATHEQLEWLQYMELLYAAGSCRLDYLHVITTLLALRSGSCTDPDSASTASSAAGVGPT